MLNEKQKRFCEEYLKDLNATQAAIRAGYSKGTAYSQGQRLLKHVEVQKFVSERTQKATAEAQITLNEVINELAKIARTNITDFIDYDNTAIKIKDSNQVDATAIMEVSITNRGKKVKTHSKTHALETLLRYFTLGSNQLDSGELKHLRELAAKQSRENL